MNCTRRSAIDVSTIRCWASQYAQLTEDGFYGASPIDLKA